MLNLDDRLLDKDLLNESELYLMLHIAKKINKDKTCFPSIRTMCKATGFGKSKVLQIRNALKQKGFIDWAQRHKNGRLTSCIYTIKTSFISIFIGLDKVGELVEESEKDETDDGVKFKTVKRQGIEKQYTEFQHTEKQATENQYNNEVLTNSFEVLTNEEVLISKEESKSVVTDIPPLAQNNSKDKSFETSNNEDFETSNVNSEKKQKKTNSGGGGEKNVSIVGKSVSLDIDKDIAPKGLTPDKIDFIFLEAERITTPEIIAKFALWHERRATKTKGVRSCKHYQKIMSKIANSDLELHEIIQGLDMAYESTWTGLEIDWIKNRTRSKQIQQNGTNNKLQQQKQYISDSPFFKGA